MADSTGSSIAQQRLDDDSPKALVLFITTLSSFLTPFIGSSINVALPAIGREFGLDTVGLGWIATSYLLAAAVFLVPFGRLADIRGRKAIFGWGVALYSLSSFLSAAAPGAGWLLAFRIFQGFGGAMMFGTAVAILTSVFPPGERGKALGINTAAVYTGLSLGPFAGGLMTQSLGWRSIFWLNGALGAVLVGVLLAKLKGEWAGAKYERFDYMGSALFGLLLVGLMYGFSRLPDALGFGLVLAGVAAGTAFVLWESRQTYPVLNINLFRRNTVFAFSNLAALINYSATFAVTFLLSLYLQYIKALTPREAGIVLVAQPVVMALFSPLTGRLSDTIEPRVLSSLGMGLSACGLLLFVFLRPETSILSIVLSLALLGLGFALFSSPNTNAVMSSVEKRYYGVASATLGTMRLTGQMLSMGTAMLVIALIVGRVKISPERFPDFLRAVRAAFVFFAVLCGAGVLASLSRGKVR